MKKKMISLFLSVVLILTLIGTLTPAVSADGEPAGPPERTIWVDDEFASYGFNSDPERTMIFNGSPENGINSYKDKISYDPETNTLTINNLEKDSDHCPLLRIYSMGQITLSVTGNSTLPHLGLYNTNLRIEGTGSLTLGTAYDLSAHEGHENETAFRYAVPVFAQNSRIQIAGDVTVKFDGDFCSIWYDSVNEAEKNSLLSWKNEVSEEPVWEDAEDNGYVLTNPTIAFIGHQHSLKKTNAVAATCEKAGRTAYYTCTGCGKYFSDKNGTKEIQKGSWKVPALGHSYKTVVLKKATTTEDGKIGSQCSRCGDIKTSKTVRKASKITLSRTAFTYNGKVQVPTVSVKDSKGTDIDKKYYTVTYSNKSSKNAGSYKIKVTLKGKYSGSKTLAYKINKKANTITKVSPTSKTFKASVLKTKNQSVTLTAAVKDNAETTYALTSVPSLAKNFLKLTPAGKLTLLKGLPAGTYSVKVKILAAATTNYSAKTLTTTITLTVR